MKIVFSKSCENTSQSLPELSKIDPQFSQDPPQTLPNPSQIDPKSMPEASWSPSWPHTWKRSHLERPKSHPRVAQSAHKTAQTVPNLSQMEAKPLPKWSPRPSQMYFLSTFLVFLFFIKICIDFWWISCWFLRARTLKNSNFLWEKQLFLLNRDFL